MKGSKVLKPIAVILAVLALGHLGRMDFEDHVAAAENCQDMVNAGVWPAEVCN